MPSKRTSTAAASTSVLASAMAASSAPKRKRCQAGRRDAQARAEELAKKWFSDMDEFDLRSRVVDGQTGFEFLVGWCMQNHAVARFTEACAQEVRSTWQPVAVQSLALLPADVNQPVDKRILEVCEALSSQARKARDRIHTLFSTCNTPLNRASHVKLAQVVQGMSCVRYLAGSAERVLLVLCHSAANKRVRGGA